MIFWHFVAGGVVLIAGMLLFLTNKFGGGDAKMMAAAALWIGWGNLLTFLIYTAMAGGALALIWLIYKPIRAEMEMRGATLFNKYMPVEAGLPYGIAIAAGAVLCFSNTWWVANFLTGGV